MDRQEVTFASLQVPPPIVPCLQNASSTLSLEPHQNASRSAETEIYFYRVQAVELGRRSIYHATHRDGASGGVARVYHVAWCYATLSKPQGRWFGHVWTSCFAGSSGLKSMGLRLPGYQVEFCIFCKPTCEGMRGPSIPDNYLLHPVTAECLERCVISDPHHAMLSPRICIFPPTACVQFLLKCILLGAVGMGVIWALLEF